MNIFEKVQKAKEMLLMANLKKSGKNTFAGYTYYELSDLLPTIIKICNELKIFTKVTFNDDLATLIMVNIEKPEEVIEYTSPMKELNLKGANAIQALGGTETYQRRYLYMAAFDIIENDMFDGAPPQKEGTSIKVDNSPPKKETAEKMKKVVGQYAEKVGVDIGTLLKTFATKVGASDITTLTETQAQSIIVRVEKQLKK